MKKKEAHDEHEEETEILKAVAQAWHGHSSNVSRPTNEFEAYRRNFKAKPSRFKLEAMNKSLATANTKRVVKKWNFEQSLWDSYEIVTTSKRLESGLVFNRHLVSDLDGLNGAISVGIMKKGKESKNSLRNLINNFSSRRFNEARISKDL